MADHCNFCDTRRPQGGTTILILNGGSFWAEFCTTCGDNEFLTDDKGKHQTLSQIFNKSDEEAPKLVVQKKMYKINMERKMEDEIIEANRLNKLARKKARAEKRKAQANSIGNLFPELINLEEAL